MLPLRSNQILLAGFLTTIQLNSVAATIQYVSADFPSFYQNEVGMFTCHYDSSYLSDDQFDRLEGYGLRRYDYQGRTEFIQLCTIHRSGQSPEVVANANTEVTLEACRAAVNLRNKMEVGERLRIPWAMRMTGNYFCSVWTDEKTFYDNHGVIEVKELLAPPRTLSLRTFPKGEFYAGDVITVTCEAEDARSTTDLEIRINKKPIRDAFTLTMDDNGKVVSCKNRRHPHYQNGKSENTYQELTITVYPDEVGYKALNYPYFYKDDVVTFRCKLNIGREFIQRVGVTPNFGLIGMDVEGSRSYKLCGILPKQDMLVPEVITYNGVVHRQACRNTLDDRNTKSFGRLTVPWTLNETGRLFCFAWDTEGENIDGFPSLTVNSFSVLPTKISMSINPADILIDGDTVHVNCESTGGKPESEFQYAIDEEPSGNYFIANSKHDKAIISCVDAIHAQYRGNHIGQVHASQRVHVFADENGYKSRNYPDTYQGEQGVFRCNFDGAKHPAARINNLDGIGLKFTHPNGKKTIFHFCRIGWNFGNGLNVFFLNEAEVSTDDCRKVVEEMRNGRIGKLTIQWTLFIPGTFHCAIWTRVKTYDDPSILTVKQMKVAPTSLTMNVNFNQSIYAGDEVFIYCKSEGGIPAADFEYGESILLLC